MLNHESFIPMLERHIAFSVHLRLMRWFFVALMFWDVQSVVAQQSVAPYSLEWEVVSTEGIPGMTTARLYAKLVNPTDYLTSVSGWDQMDGRIETTTSFYQDPDGWVTPNNNNPLLFDLLPTLRYDSWVTIGIDVAPSGVDGEIPIGVFPPESGYWVSDFEEGNDLVMDVDGAWFVTLGSTNGTAGEDLRVLVGQFTTDGVVTGTLNLQVFSEGVSSDDFMDDVYAITVPEFDASNPLGVEDAVGPLNWTVTRLPFGYAHRLDARGTWERLDVMGRMLESGVTEDGRFQTSGGGFVCFWSECRKRSVRKWIPN